MTSFTTRLFCAILSTVGAAGIVTYVDPASAISRVAPSPHAAAAHAVAMAAAATTAGHRG